MHLNRQLVRQKTAKTINGLLYSGIFCRAPGAPSHLGGARFYCCAWHTAKNAGF